MQDLDGERHGRPDLSGPDEHLAVLAVVDRDCVGVVEEVDAAVLAVPHYHLLPCEKDKDQVDDEGQDTGR